MFPKTKEKIKIRNDFYVKLTIKLFYYLY